VRRRTVTTNVLANLVNAGTSIAAAAISVPLVLHYIGIDGFGVWTLAQTALVYTATAETGFGPAVQRFVSVAHGARDRAGAARVVWSASGFYFVLGGAVAVLMALLAPAIVSIFDVPHALHDDAVAMFRITGVAMLFALVAAGLANVLQGIERFAAAAVATGISAVVFLGAAIVLLADGYGLKGLAEAALAQQVVGVLVRVWMVRDVLLAAPFARVSRREARELVGFSARLQVGVLSTLVNSQTDKLVVGLVATTAAIGEVGIGSQVAEAVRFMAGAALGPVLARLAIVHGEGAHARLAALYHQAEFVWLRLGAGLTVVACAVMQPLIAAWLGDKAGRAALYGVLLMCAYGLSTLAAAPLAYLRAIGRPGLEARYGLVTIVANVVLTVALGIAFGPVGVVSATLVAYATGTGWLFLRLRGVLPPRAEPPRPGPGRAVVAAIVAGAAALGWGLLVVEVLPRWVALVLVALGAAAAFAGYAVAATGVRLSAGGVRALLVPDRAVQ
jgi:O-antigen/teichoic acid export membrane protein